MLGLTHLVDHWGMTSLEPDQGADAEFLRCSSHVPSLIRLLASGLLDEEVLSSSMSGRVMSQCSEAAPWWYNHQIDIAATMAACPVSLQELAMTIGVYLSRMDGFWMSVRARASPTQPFARRLTKATLIGRD